MDICVDFDGTCVTNEFPKIGKDIGAVPVLKRLVEEGHRIILFTMRSDRREVVSTGDEIHPEPGSYLTDALNWFKEKGIPLHGVNQNPDQHKWTDSPKAYGHIYIDDAALGCPTTLRPEASKFPFVLWRKVEYDLEMKGVLQPSGRRQYTAVANNADAPLTIEALLLKKGVCLPPIIKNDSK